MEIVDRTDHSYFQGFRVVGRLGPGEIRERGGVLSVYTGTPVAWLNVAFVTRPLERPEPQIAEAVAFFDSLGVGFVVRIRERLDPASETACQRLGMPFFDTVPGMASTSMNAPAPPPELRIETVGDAQLPEFRALIASGFGMPLEIVSAYVPSNFTRDPEMESYIGYLGDQPVATSSLVFGGRVAGVYNVSTHPGFRKHGYGEALTWQAVRRGAELGCDMAALQASDMGRPIYERMGFRLVSPYKTFHRPGI